jgi:hypothetical protein
MPFFMKLSLMLEGNDKDMPSGGDSRANKKPLIQHDFLSAFLPQ